MRFFAQITAAAAALTLAAGTRPAPKWQLHFRLGQMF